MVKPRLSIMKIRKLGIIGVLIIAAVLRLYGLSDVPPHLTPDEASLGYNAYSILKTGRDEYGELLPIVFKSFGDYKPGLYIYLTAIPISLLGLNEIAVRLPSALAGVAGVYLIYLIIKRLEFDGYFPLVVAMLLAINPWHIYFSRGAWEVNIALTLTLLGIYYFFVSFQKPNRLILSALFFALTLLTYQGAKMSTGIVGLILLGIYHKEIFKIDKRIIISSVALALIIAFPIILSIFQGKAGRLYVFSVFTYPREEESLAKFLGEAMVSKGSLAYYIFYSEYFNFFRGIMGRWFNHFSGSFLFFEGDWQNVRHSIPNHGVLLFADAISLVLGFYYFLKRKFSRKLVFVLLWLLLAPLPSALSRDQVHGVRSFYMVIPMIVLIAGGIVNILKTAKIGRFLILGLYFLSFIYFLDAYFVHLPRHNSQYWDYGYKQIVESVSPIQDNYKKIIVQQSYAQPYIYFLFYQKYDPARYQEKANLIASEVSQDVGKVEQLDNIVFGPIDWSVNRGKSGVLFVADIIRIPPEDSVGEEFKLVSEINYLDGWPAFRIIEVK